MSRMPPFPLQILTNFQSFKPIQSLLSVVVPLIRNGLFCEVVFYSHDVFQCRNWYGFSLVSNRFKLTKALETQKDAKIECESERNISTICGRQFIQIKEAFVSL